MTNKPYIDTKRNGYHFRSICEADKELFMGLRSEASDIAPFYRLENGFSDYSWTEDLADESTVYMMVFLEADGKFVSACSFQGINRDTVELGYDVVAEYRGQGMGTAIVKELAALAHETFPEKQINIRIRKDNTASRRVAEKCGGKLTGTVDSPTSVYFRQLLEKLGGDPEFKRRFDPASLQNLVERGRDAIVIYEI